MDRICVNWDDRMAVLVERQTALAKNQWDEFRTFFAYDKNNFGGLDTLFDKLRFSIGTKLLDEFRAWKQFTEYCESRKPYTTRMGYSDNDLDPAQGVLSNFNYKGSIALDYNLRSVGTDLESIKPIVAIRLRRTTEETRVKPENLSLWISNDNKLYRRYSGKITFSNESRAITLDHLDIIGQFIKIHCDFQNDKYTFVEDFNKIVDIYGPPRFQEN